MKQFNVDKVLKNIKEIHPLKLEGHMTAAKLSLSIGRKSGLIRGGGWDLYWKKDKNGEVKPHALIRSEEKLEDYYE